MRYCNSKQPVHSSSGCYSAGPHVRPRDVPTLRRAGSFVVRRLLVATTEPDRCSAWSVGIREDFAAAGSGGLGGRDKR